MIHPTTRFRVLWQIIRLCTVLASTNYAQAQRPDSTQVDSIHRIAFNGANSGIDIRKPERTIDLTLTGGAGNYSIGDASSFQPLANADFFAQTSNIDLMAGFHWGFSNPPTEALTIGLRFPLTEVSDEHKGIFCDAGLLFTDDGADSDAFSTGFRAALAMRWSPIEIRLAGELRRFPFDGNQTLAWAGIEAGFFINLLREEVTEPTRKDSLHAQLRYIATSAELEELDKVQSNPDIDQWFDKFWRARNVTGSARNDEREEYMRRVSSANQRYGTPRTMGVSTDMGRVLLLYGEPDHKESAQSLSVGSDRRFELWVYQDRIKAFRTGLLLFMASKGSQTMKEYDVGGHEMIETEGHGEFREVYSNLPGESSEGIPYDLPPTMVNYIESFK